MSLLVIPKSPKVFQKFEKIGWTPLITSRILKSKYSNFTLWQSISDDLANIDVSKTLISFSSSEFYKLVFNGLIIFFIRNYLHRIDIFRCFDVLFQSVVESKCSYHGNQRIKDDIFVLPIFDGILVDEQYELLIFWLVVPA